MPNVSSVYLWIIKNKDFSNMYAHAREDQADTYSDQIVDIGEEVPMMVITDEDGKVTKRIDPAGVNRNRLRVDARKWVASKLKPRTYGDRLDVSVSDNRISVIQALEQAQARVQIGMAKSDDVTDIEPK
jgi:hypothetical protein